MGKFICLEYSLIKISGEKSKEFLQGICTNDLNSLKPGSGIGAAFLDRFGKVLSVSSIYNIENYFLIQSDFSAHTNLFAYLKDLAGFSECKTGDLSKDFCVFSLFGSEGFFAERETILKNPISKNPEILIRRGLSEEFKKSLKEKGFDEMDKEEYEQFRTGNRILEFGKDYDNTYMILDLGLENIISYTKGCYTGQEIVARMKAYSGQVSRKIVKMKFNQREEVLEKEKLFSGMQEVGLTTSIGKGICLGTVKKGFFEKGMGLETGNKVKLAVD